MSKVRIDTIKLNKDEYKNFKWVYIDKYELCDPTRLCRIFGIDSKFEGLLPKLEIGSYAFTWEGNNSLLNGLALEGNEIKTMENGYLYDMDGNLFAYYLEISSNKKENKKYHLVTVFPIVNT